MVPGLTREVEGGCPDTLREFWSGEMFSFHSKDWWRHLWEKTGAARITACYNMENPKEIWRPWAEWAKEHRGFIDVEFLEADTHGDLALIVMSAIRL